MKRLKTITAGRLVAGVCYTAATSRDGPRERAAKSQMSSAAQERINLRRAWQKLELLLAANFGPGDVHVVLTYDDDHVPSNRETANRRLRKLIGQLRSHRKARGQPTRYIYVTEQLSAEGGRLHHHMILNGTGADIEVLRSLWPDGQVDLERLDLWEGYEALAKYLTKEPRESGKAELGARSWTPSVGLTKPKVDTQRVPDNVTISPPPGAIVLDRHEEKNEYGEYLYIKYLLPERKEAKKGQRPPRRRKSESPSRLLSVWKPPVSSQTRG